MHGRYDALHHHHHHAHGQHEHAHGSAEGHTHGPVGHNHGPGRPVQWQTPHTDEALHHHDAGNDDIRDLDLVENAFVEGFQAASDPTSFLRLAGVPFDAVTPNGTRMTLLRVEQQRATDVGSVTPHFGGASFNYAPLPAKMTSRRETLSFMYFDGSGVMALTLGEARELKGAPGDTGPDEGPTEASTG